MIIDLARRCMSGPPCRGRNMCGRRGVRRLGLAASFGQWRWRGGWRLVSCAASLADTCGGLCRNVCCPTMGVCWDPLQMRSNPGQSNRGPNSPRVDLVPPTRAGGAGLYSPLPKRFGILRGIRRTLACASHSSKCDSDHCPHRRCMSAAWRALRRYQRLCASLCPPAVPKKCWVAAAGHRAARYAIAALQHMSTSFNLLTPCW